MKSPQALIRERVGNALLADRAKTVVFAYVRPRKDGEATIEYWGARKHKGKVKCKCFFKFRTDRDRYDLRDIVYYHGYSSLCPSHLCYHFPEAGSQDYIGRVTDDPQARKWAYDAVSNTEKCFLPRYAPILNDWSGTRYKYCGYDHNCGMFALDYLRFWEKYPKAEILSKAGCFRLLTEPFMKRLERDKPFAKWIARYHAAITEHAYGIRDLYELYRTKRDPNAFNDFMRERERRREAIELAKAQNAAKKLREEYSQYDRAIMRLYEKVKDICATYGAYEVIVPQTAQEMLAEGAAMHNCIGKCYAPRQGKQDLCLFLHRDGKPCVDIRIDLKTFELMECRAVCNKDAPDDAWEVARELAEMCRMRLAA